MLTLHNLTRRSLIPYPVEVNPPPPHRVRDLVERIAFGCSGPMDPNSFNPVFCSEEFEGPDTEANGVHFGFDFSNVPGTVLARVFHHKVAPGQDGGDPMLQPLLLHEAPIEAGPDSAITIDHNWFSALGRAEQPTQTLDAFPRDIATGATLDFDACRGVPGEQVRLFTKLVSGVPNSKLIAAGNYDASGAWSHQTVNPGGAGLRPGNKVVLVAFTRDAAGDVVETDEVEVTIV